MLNKLLYIVPFCFEKIIWFSIMLKTFFFLWFVPCLFISHPIRLQPALSLCMMVSCWTWITRLLNDEHAGWLFCSLAWLIIGCEWGAGVSPYSLWVILGRVSLPCLPHTDAPVTYHPFSSSHPTPTASFSDWWSKWRRESCAIRKMLC